jgi:hypothetical protein
VDNDAVADDAQLSLLLDVHGPATVEELFAHRFPMAGMFSKPDGGIGDSLKRMTAGSQERLELGFALDRLVLSGKAVKISLRDRTFYMTRRQGLELLNSLRQALG